jgi:adenylate cyclase
MKQWKKWVSFLSSPLFVGLIITFSCSAVAFLYYVEIQNPAPGGIYETLKLIHQKSIDARLRARGIRSPSPQVAILTVDEKALEQVGRWPWSRDKIATVIEELRKYGAKVVSFDIVFAERDQNSAGPTLERLKTRLNDTPKAASPELLNLLDAEIQKTNTDQILAKAIAKGPEFLILGAYFDPPEYMNAVQELCMDVAYTKSPMYQNWAKEAVQVIVNDTAATELPAPWIPILETHFKTISVSTTENWLKKNASALTPARRELTQNFNITVSDEDWPLILVSYLDRDQETIKAFLAQKDSARTWSEEDIERFFQVLAQPLALARVDLLRTEGTEQHTKYCQRFLTGDDELKPELEKVWPEVQNAKPEFANASFTDGIEILKAMTLINPIPSAGRWWMNIPELVEASTNNGYFNANLDSDGTIRRSWLIARSGAQYMTSIGFRGFLQSLGYGALATLERNVKHPEEKFVSELKIIDGEGEPVMTVPVDHSGAIMINYAGPQYSFPYLSIAELMTKEPTATITRLKKNEGGVYTPQEEVVQKAEFIKDKIFVFGATALGIFDMRVTPFQENYAGVETHANVVDNLLRKDFLRAHADEEIYMPLFILVFGIVLSVLLARFSALPSVGLAMTSLVAVYFFDKHFLFNSGIVTTIILPLMAVGLLFLGIVSYKYFTEERKKKEIKGTFEKYVSPSVVNEILADPSNLELGGRKETITVFFSDVRGFTTISEKLDPRALSDLLNSYLTPMTRLVFEHKGTLDKYMGDAIMAFFGAPIHYSDHAKHACRCALSHIEKLKELQAEYERKGLPQIDIGIGLNTGEASVGNMGSDIVRNYTVMGDTVNLGSRLEGINKQYGTRIIISEFTRNEIGNDFTVREVDWVRVKGKAQPVRIYELISEGPSSADVMEMVKWFNEGFEFYHQHKFQQAMDSFTKSLNVKPDDECSKLYIERCNDYLLEPPGQQWDGVYTMKTK